MAIKQLLELIGDDIVIAKLDKVQKKGEEALNSFNKSTSDLKLNVDSGPIEQTTGHVVKLTEVLHTLRPILQAAGLQFSEFGALTRLAGTSLAALGIATVGAVVVGLAKLEESAAKTKGRLDDLFGSQKLGSEAFKQLQDSAQSLGTTVENIAPGFEAFRTALDRFIATNRTFKFVAPPGIDLPPALAGNIKSTTDAYTNFIKILRAGRLDTSEATKAATDFSKVLAQTGTVTADALRGLPTGTVDLLAKAMGRGQVSAQQFIQEVALTPIPINKLIEALARFGPQAQQAFDTKAIKSINDELSALFATFNDEFQKLGGLKFSVFLVSELEKFRVEIADTIDRIVAIKQLLSSITPTTPLSEALEKLRQAARIAIAPTVTADPAALTEAEKAGEAAAEAYRKGFRTAPPAQADFVKEQFSAIETNAEQTGQTVATDLNKPIDLSAQQQSFTTLFEAVVAGGQAAYNRLVSVFSQAIPVNFDTRSILQSTAPFASGGLVRGSGTTTSDSILALLSNREFVVNARATSFYGPDLFAALNAMKLPRDFVSRFSMGGLARAIGGNRFAAGGTVSTTNGNRSLTLVLDQKRFSVTGSKGTIDDLEREASLRGLAMIGKAPSWIR